MLSHNPAAELGHSFTPVSLLPRQRLGWVWLVVGVVVRAAAVVGARTLALLHTHTHTRLASRQLIFTHKVESLCTQKGRNLLNVPGDSYRGTYTTDAQALVCVCVCVRAPYGYCTDNLNLNLGKCSKCCLLLVSSRPSKAVRLLCIYSKLVLLCALAVRGEQTIDLLSAGLFLLSQTRAKTNRSNTRTKKTPRCF